MEQSHKRLEQAMGQLFIRAQQREAGKLPGTVEKNSMVTLTVSEKVVSLVQVTQAKAISCTCCHGSGVIL